MLLTIFFIITKCCAVLKISWWWIILMIAIDGLYANACREIYYEKRIKEEKEMIKKYRMEMNEQLKEDLKYVEKYESK